MDKRMKQNIMKGAMLGKVRQGEECVLSRSPHNAWRGSTQNTTKNRKTRQAIIRCEIQRCQVDSKLLASAY